MTADWPGRTDEPPGERRPLGPLDPGLIHRARAINADALRVIDELLDQAADSGRT